MRAYVIAMECEADCVRPFLRGDDMLVVSGIGKVNAAAAAQRAIDAGADEIWNAGLCGGFGDDVELGGVYEVESAVEYDFDLADLNGTAIGVLDGRSSPYIPCSVRGGFAARRLATGDRFNDSEADHGLIRDTLGCSLRDMEGAAIAHVCELAGVSCRELKCVSDVAGKGSMTGQYESNKQACLARLSEALAKACAM